MTLKGKAIAKNIESYHASIILEEVADINKALASLNQVLPEKKIDINKTIKKIKKSKKFVPVQIIDNLSWDEFAKLNSNLYQLKGVFQLWDTRDFILKKNLMHTYWGIFQIYLKKNTKIIHFQSLIMLNQVKLALKNLLIENLEVD